MTYTGVDAAVLAALNPVEKGDGGARGRADDKGTPALACRGELGDLSRTMSALTELYYAATIKVRVVPAKQRPEHWRGRWERLHEGEAKLPYFCVSRECASIAGVGGHRLIMRPGGWGGVSQGVDRSPNCHEFIAYRYRLP